MEKRDIRGVRGYLVCSVSSWRRERWGCGRSHSTRPKVMLPLANRPMLEHLVTAARDAGVSEFLLVVG